MKQKNQKCFCTGVCLLAAFAVWTVLLQIVDVQSIGPLGSEVGFVGLNRFFHDLTGVGMWLYVITDWLSLIPVGVAMGFAFLGLSQWISRKKLGKVDGSILLLGGFYIVVMAVYVFFEVVVINYRPVLINGVLESSYPSSTTVLVICVMTTAVIQCHVRIRNGDMRRYISAGFTGFGAFMVMGRLLSGVHWVTDIVGGMLLSGGLVLLYRSFIGSEQV